MYTKKYFENMFKKKRKFNITDIAKMQQRFIIPYIITNHIDRYKLMDNIHKINNIRKKMLPKSKPLVLGI